MSAIDSTAVTGEMVPASPANAGAGSTRAIALGLVAFALLLWGASVGVFLTHSLDELPLYFAKRYLVLDPTSLLFVLVINTVFLGISVYMLSRSPTSTGKVNARRSRPTRAKHRWPNAWLRSLPAGR